MLQYDHQVRPTCKEAMAHPYFARIRAIEQSEQIPNQINNNNTNNNINTNNSVNSSGSMNTESGNGNNTTAAADEKKEERR